VKGEVKGVKARLLDYNRVNEYNITDPEAASAFLSRGKTLHASKSVIFIYSLD
jgi:hypothetical protein